MHLKQACSYLIYFGNDFERFLREALVFHPNGKISLIDMHKIKYMAALQSGNYNTSSQDTLDAINNLKNNIQEEEFEDDYDESELKNKKSYKIQKQISQIKQV